MAYVELVAVLAVLQLMFFGVMTGLARRKSGLQAPAMTGDEKFERMYRVQMNTLELIPIFLVGLLVAGRHWSPLIVAGIGCVYLIGRIIYWRSYVADPASRSTGFVLSMLPSFVLVVLALAGILMAII
jgi:uncharacterized membrane protein YecN with MAPEG domain